MKERGEEHCRAEDMRSQDKKVRRCGPCTVCVCSFKYEVCSVESVRGTREKRWSEAVLWKVLRASSSLDLVRGRLPVKPEAKAVRYITIVFDRIYSWHGQLPLPLLTRFLPRSGS